MAAVSTVPQFTVAPLTCGCEDGLRGLPCRAMFCTLRVLGEFFAFSFRHELGLLAPSFTSERVVNTSLRLLRGPPSHCFTGGRALLPQGTVARVTYCSAYLVSGSLGQHQGQGVLRVWLVDPRVQRVVPKFAASRLNVLT